MSLSKVGFQYQSYENSAMKTAHNPPCSGNLAFIRQIILGKARLDKRSEVELIVGSEKVTS